jgi:hypothetical protein
LQCTSTMRVNVNVTVADAAWTLALQSQNTSPLVMSMPAASADNRIRVARRFAGLLDVFIGFPLLVRPPGAAVEPSQTRPGVGALE